MPVSSTSIAILTEPLGRSLTAAPTRHERLTPPLSVNFTAFEKQIENDLANAHFIAANLVGNIVGDR